MACHDNTGAIDQPEAGSYTLSYGEAVDLGYCRPATFHRHEGRFTVTLNSGESVSVSGQGSSDLPRNLKRIPGLQRALDFALLAKTPQFESDNVTPLNGGYQCTMMEWAIASSMNCGSDARGGRLSYRARCGNGRVHECAY